MAKSILFDATHVDLPKPTGVELYTRELLPRVSTLLLKKGVHVLWVGHSVQAPAIQPDGVQWIHSPHKRFWSQRVMSGVIAEEKVQAFFTPSGIPPLTASVPTAMTIHDMSVFSASEAYSFAQQIRLRWLARMGASKARLIFTPSEFTRQQVEQRWGIRPTRLLVTPLAAPTLTTAPQSIDKLAPNTRFITYIGRLESKKNLTTLIKAFALVKADPELFLVMAGSEGIGVERIRTAVRRLPNDVKKRLILPGYINDGQKRWLYEHASLVVIPSAREGFGIPLLEAFTAGIPVVAAEAGALPEIGAGAAFFVNPYNPVAWAAQIEFLLNNPIKQKEAAAAGKKIAERFTWERTASLTAEGLFTLIS